VKRFLPFQASSFAYGLRLLLKLFSVLFHVLCDGWNKTLSSTRNGICFTVLFQFSFSCATSTKSPGIQNPSNRHYACAVASSDAAEL